MQPVKQWLEKYEKVKNLLISPVDYNQLFRAKEVLNKKTFVVNMGTITFPTGQILVRDPIVYLHPREEAYFIKVPIGTFQLETLVAEIRENHYMYIATRIKFTEEKSVIYEEALIGYENLDDVDENSFFGFQVDTGLVTIVDVQIKDAYHNFCEEWSQDNPEKEIYNTYFSEKFKESYKNSPHFQIQEGNWINFTIPGTNLNMPMICPGFGEATYFVYFGRDSKGEISEIVIEYLTVDSLDYVVSE
ncbi:DUF4241 domain-containing protein [Actinomyces sp. zg-332]|uniref:DUF4241 domain-containing protein n=1 Tax=Actinomyces sp. zg-332 TaxID=2708340 RepID=UPI001421A8C2|nr:DUF4241 domain-containing protein [Actinomyces sp. zg-332]QPK93676.1 DUF4241 domain-containing protein [Actinomyces sp. zg-332]